MRISAAKDTGLFCLLVLAGISVSSQLAMAGDLNLFNKISPHISLSKNAPNQELQAFAITNNPGVGDYIMQGGHYSPPAKKSMSDQDLFSLALGARFQISDWLGVDAACAMPLAEEETTWKRDLAIEAMVTMQF